MERADKKSSALGPPGVASLGAKRQRLAGCLSGGDLHIIVWYAEESHSIEETGAPEASLLWLRKPRGPQVKGGCSGNTGTSA